MDEFEDAMDSSFYEFIARFPIVEVKPDERVTGGHVFRVCPALPSGMPAIPPLLGCWSSARVSHPLSLCDSVLEVMA